MAFAGSSYAFRRFALVVLGVLPVAWLAVGFARDALGANPVEKITHVTGDWALRWLLATLAVTPLRQWLGWHWLAPHRRTLGLLSGLARELDAGVDPMRIVFPYVVGSALPLAPDPG